LSGVDALFARALALEDAGQLDAALGCYGELLAAFPSHADAWHNRGLLLARLGRFAEAEQSHREYLQRFPESVRAQGDLTDVLLALGRNEKVAEVLANATEPTLLVRRGVAWSCLGRFAEAQQDFDLARARDPSAVAQFVRRAAPTSDPEEMLSPENIFLARRYAAQGRCDWHDWDGYVALMRRAADDDAIVLEPAIAYQAVLAPLTGRERHSIARRAARRVEQRSPVLPSAGPRRPNRIRIGVLSPDFRDHVDGYKMLPLLQLIDRSRFEMLAYSLGPDDRSPVRKELVAAAGAFRSLERASDAEAAAAIRRDDVDILLDLCGYMGGARPGIVLRRPARVQAAFPGFAGSLGSKRVDFAIVDRIVAPDAEEWSETLVYLPDTFYLYDFRRPEPGLAATRAEYGLPADAFVFCAFHGATKITPDTFDLWMRILREANRSVLWFRALAGECVARLRASAAVRGVDPSRLFFAPFEPSWDPRYLARHRLGDLLLDALHHNAITNACDALRMGLPVLTTSGSSMATRAGESLLRAAGLPELVAPDREAFVREAVRLASDTVALAHYKQRLRDVRYTAPLFDTAGRVRQVEACLEEMIQVSDQSRSRL
jgi:protein O-GlcNAc transferase